MTVQLADGWTSFPRLGPRPVAAETMVFVRYRNGQEVGPVKASARRWDRFPDQRSPSDFDIVAWRPAGADA